MKFHISVGYFIVSVCSVGFRGTFSFELPKGPPYTIDRNENSNSRIWEWIPQIIEGVSESLDTELRVLSGDNVKQLADKQVLFYSYTKNNPIHPQAISMNSVESVRNSFFQADVSTVFITHGWFNRYNFDSCTSIRDALLSGPEPVNVIVVDWSPFSMSVYQWSVEKVETVGNQIARMIDFLARYAKLNLQKTTLIGHSLGAHVMGVAGRRTNGMVNQIFGLDPARPMFEDPTNPVRLSKNCARNVQVIHTNAGGLGLSEPLGHADFYPNGGASQPGCEAIDLVSVGACSHGRAFYLLAESFNPRANFVGFQALRCRRGENVFKGQCRGQVGTMGGRSNRISESGVFYLKTGAASPFAYRLRLKKN